MIPKMLVLLFLVVPLPALASDGQIEINHARALVGNVTVGDASGYPVTLGVSGSYRLTGELIQPDPSTSVIEVTAANVSIDLGGFAIRGTNVCTLSTRNVSGKIIADDVSCTQAAASGDGIDGNIDGLSVRNGVITGIGGNGIVAGNHARIEGVQISHTGGNSILLRSYGAVRDAVLTLSRASGIFENGSGGTYDHITASRHDRMGLEAIGDCTVTNTTANWNAFYGFDIRQGCSATNVSANRNSNHGFSASRALLAHCNAAWNGGRGISGSGGYDGCVFEGNEGGSTFGMTRLGPSLCDGSPCP